MTAKILIVDDSITARKLVCQLIHELGHSFVEAEDGKKGLEVLEHEAVDLIFSDINMPWMTGLEMVEEIKKKPEWSEIPICMLTTESSRESLQKAKDLGVNAFLVKPLQKEQLDAVLCLLYTSPSPRDLSTSRMPSSA